LSYRQGRLARHVTLISADPQFTALLAKNLERRLFKVDVRLLGPAGKHGVVAYPTSDSRLVLDLEWFQPARRDLYEDLSRLSRSITNQQMCILLADDTWSATMLKSFQAAHVLHKPVAIDALRGLLDSSRRIDGTQATL
jgi:hypothetical protein